MENAERGGLTLYEQHRGSAGVKNRQRVKGKSGGAVAFTGKQKKKKPAANGGIAPGRRVLEGGKGHRGSWGERIETLCTWGKKVRGRNMRKTREKVRRWRTQVIQNRKSGRIRQRRRRGDTEGHKT